MHANVISWRAATVAGGREDGKGDTGRGGLEASPPYDTIGRQRVRKVEFAKQPRKKINTLTKVLITLNVV